MIPHSCRTMEENMKRSAAFISLFCLVSLSSPVWAFSNLVPDFRVDQGSIPTDVSIPALDIDGNNRYVVAWQDWRTGNSHVYARRLNASGSPLGASFLVDQAPEGTDV